MNDRITLISLFNTEDLNKINKVIKNVSEPLCKVPYRDFPKIKVTILNKKKKTTTLNI